MRTKRISEIKNWIAGLALVSLSVFGAAGAQDLPPSLSSGGKAINWTQAVSQNGEESHVDPLIAPPGSWESVPAVDPVPTWESESIWNQEPLPELLPGLWQSASLGFVEEGQWEGTAGVLHQGEGPVGSSLAAGPTQADVYFLLGTSMVVALVVCQVRRKPEVVPEG